MSKQIVKSLGWICLFALFSSQVPPAEMVRIPAGEFIPQFTPRPGQSRFEMQAFWMDRFPVSQGEFLTFVKAHPQWQRSQIPDLFQEGHYLSHWQGDLALPLANEADPEPAKQAVTQVSWMAARAYCAAQGKRLPTLLEWEYAADEKTPEKLLWYSQVGIGIPGQIGQQAPNAKGVYDLHQMYEWVSDFNQVIMTNDSREGNERDTQLFCGSSASASDRMNYAAFTRYAFWSSLKPAYTLKNLGFRCAKND